MTQEDAADDGRPDDPTPSSSRTDPAAVSSAGTAGSVGPTGVGGGSGVEGPVVPAAVDGAVGLVGAVGVDGTSGADGRVGSAGASGAGGADGAARVVGAAGGARSARRLGPVVGLDVGGTKTLALIADADGATIARLRRPTDAAGPAGLLATVTAAVADVATAGGVDVGEVVAVGVGVPGIVDPASGAVRHAVNLGVGEAPLDLAGPLSALIGGGPVVVGNDANMAALGAAEALAATGDVAYLSIGTGVAAGFVLGGRLHVGVRGMAGEIGHLPVDPYGPLCECGQRGCLEAVASGQAIARRWPRPDGQPGDVAALLAAALAGDERAIAVRDDVCHHIAAALALVAQTVDPAVLVLGGGVADAGEPLLAAVRAALHRRAQTAPLLASLSLEDRIELVPADVPVGALGAVRAARDALTPANSPAVVTTGQEP
jgi:glucokinase